jgi:hypothetical protein
MEYEMTESFAGAIQRGSSRPLSNNKTQAPFFLKILLVLFVFVGLLIKLDIHIDTVLLMNSKGKELKKVSSNSVADMASVSDDGGSITNGAAWKYMRWQLDGSVEDNCIPGFHLAETNLTCGLSVNDNDVTWLSVRHEGIDYCAGVEFMPNTCVEPMYGFWALPGEDTSVIPPLPRRFGIGGSEDNISRSRCRTMKDFLDNGTLTGRGEYHPPEWVQSVADASSIANRLSVYDVEYVPFACSSVPLSPFLWTEYAKCQTTITMYGDSHIRNLFIATVFGLRGVDMFAEAHADAEKKDSGIIYSYEWRLHNDGSADDKFGENPHMFSGLYIRYSLCNHMSDICKLKLQPLEYHDGTNFANSTYKVSHCSCDMNVRRCLRIFFVWAPLFREQLNTFHFVREWETDLLIVEPGTSHHNIIACKYLGSFS